MPDHDEHLAKLLSAESFHCPDGSCYWLTGLSGVGKTTIGLALLDLMRTHGLPTIFFDGDLLRESLGVLSPKHSTPERLKLALYYGRLCRVIATQGINVVIATISLFHEVQEWNRQHIPGYREIYLKAPLEDLCEHDKSSLYSRALAGEVDDVMGVHLPIEEPRSPDLVVNNDRAKSPQDVAQMIWLFFTEADSPRSVP